MKTLKHLLKITLAIALLWAQSLSADIKGSIEQLVEFPREGTNGRYFVRGNFLKGFDKIGLQTYTFMELYNQNNNGDKYFWETNLFKKLFKKLDLKAEIKHINSPFSQIGLGPKLNIPNLAENISANISALPIYFSKEGRVKNKAELQYFITGKLPKGFSFYSFGNVNPFAEEGWQWIYGEFNLAKQVIDNIKIGTNLGLIKDKNGKILPKIEPRLNLEFEF